MSNLDPSPEQVAELADSLWDLAAALRHDSTASNGIETIKALRRIEKAMNPSGQRHPVSDVNKESEAVGVKPERKRIRCASCLSVPSTGFN